MKSEAEIKRAIEVRKKAIEESKAKVAGGMSPSFRHLERRNQDEWANAIYLLNWVLSKDGDTITW